ncbi:ComEC family protein [Pseudescherichia sp.]|uniref:ComEC family protein n=1 Tax=Pseudescherichia sp. TaxID=2055881 RepID=UPI00289897A3|nr:ComEC family protein [Pseudescherichia sp.]
MGLPAVAFCLITAVLPLLWLPALPELSGIAAIVIAGCLLGFVRYPRIRWLALWLLFFAWGLLAAQEALWPTKALPGATQRAVVKIVATDNMTVHRGIIEQLDGRRLFPAPGINLYGQYLPQPGCAGQRWQMTLKVRPIHGQLNEGGFDTQRYALAQHRPVSGRFIHATPIDLRCDLRARYLSSLGATLAPYAWQPIMLGLGMGERAALSADVKALMRETGTAHLMAISGLHIALAASLGWLLMRGIQFFLPGNRISWRLPLLFGLTCAAYYAWLTGMQPPALRTVVSLAVWGALRLSGRQWSPWQVWLCCVAAILFIDPVAILSQSLGLSAFAVAALIFWYQWFPLPRLPGGRSVRSVLNLVHLQMGMMILLLPIQVTIFHGISLTSIVANLVAVPLVTFVTVPLILTGMVLHLSGPAMVESGCWLLADKTLALLVWFLRQLPDGWYDIDQRWLGLVWLPWAGIVLWRLRIYTNAPFLSLALAMLLMLPRGRPARGDEWAVHMLDVGQGLAMVITRNQRAMLYDTGLAWPGGDSAQQLIVPWLRWHHLRPDGIILSHEHLDHRGGLETLKKAWPEMTVRSPLGWAGHLPCYRGQRWQWQGLTFTVHWPLAGEVAKGNNGSCVVKVDDGRQSILLTGDVEAPAERRMLSRYWQHLQATLIQVPHHGSSTSSSLPLLQRVNGQAALASASRYNAWRLPSTKVIRRYRQQGYRWYDTPHEGQTSVYFSTNGWKILGLRKQLLPRWYHQRFGVPADNG